MTRIHHNTMKKAEALGLKLAVNSKTGNVECEYNGDLYEADNARELVEAIALDIQGNEDADLSDYLVEQDGDDGEEEDGKGSVVKEKYRKLYQPHHDTNGDEMAAALHTFITDVTFSDSPRKPGYKVKHESVNQHKLESVAIANGFSTFKWMHLNLGMRRMNTGNKLRALLRNGTPVTIGDQQFRPTPKSE